ncbi:O-antigen translocase [Paraglaciecola sp.]|nr:O-antigen translocase [Paraglaciecola sp.]
MTSHRQIFRSSAIIGGSSLINMLIGIVKVKVLALMLGPVGIGLMGLYMNIMSIAAIIASCGMGSIGVRQVAAVADEEETLSLVRRALWFGSLILGVAGMAILWLLREPVALLVFGDDAHASDVGWLGLGLLFTLIAGTQTAVLQGLRRIGDLAKVTIISGLIGALLGISAAYLFGTNGVVWFVVAAPATSFLAASYYAARLPRPQAACDLSAIRRQWLVILKLGIPLMSAGLLMLATPLVVRTFVVNELGLDASGFFQAAWIISFTYVGFVLNAMAMDYFPRLTTTIGDPQRAGKLVNEQTEMGLLLAGPALLAMITFAPWVIQLLYAESFSPAAQLLSWQVLGDILKVASWPMSYIFLAAGRSRTYIGTQIIWSGAYLGTFIPGVSEWGLVMAGAGFAVGHLCFFAVTVIVAKRFIGFRLSRRNMVCTLLLLLAGGLTIYMTSVSAIASYSLGSCATVLFGLYSLHRLNHLIDLTGLLRRRLQ